MPLPEEMTAGARTIRRRRLLSAAAFALLLCVGTGFPANAQESTTRPNADVAVDAIAQLRSPYCPGLMLEVCPSPSAAALRDSIYDLAEQGQTSEQIVEWMLGRHGEEWRGVPQTSGAGLWAWIIPPVAILAALWFALGWLRRNRSSPVVAGTADVGTKTVSDQDREKLAAAMKEWEDSGEEEV